MYRGALRAIVSELVRSGRLRVVETLELPEAKTRALAARLSAMGLDDVLIVDGEPGRELLLSARNLHWAAVAEGAKVSPVSLMAFDQVVVTEAGLRKLEERLQ